MKGIRLTAMLPALLLAGVCQAEVTVHNDRFTGETVIKAEDVSTTQYHVPGLLWVATVKGKKVVELGMAVVMQERDWRYLDCHQTKWLVDGKPLDMPPLTHDGSVHVGSVTEILKAAVTLPQVATLMRAKSIEYRICNDEFAFTPAQVSDIQQFGLHLSQQISHPD